MTTAGPHYIALNIGYGQLVAESARPMSGRIASLLFLGGFLPPFSPWRFLDYPGIYWEERLIPNTNVDIIIDQSHFGILNTFDLC